MTKIMLVEDDNNLREIYEARLLAEGYEIVSAQDGEEALAIAVKEKPDLIISDVMMPKISGFDMLDILRSTPETKDTKVIMMTALSQAEDKQRADRLGADRYLVKSQVTLEDVAKVAREVIDNHPTQTPAAVVPEIVASPDPASAAPAAQIPVSEPVAATPAPNPTQVAATPEPVAATPVPEPAQTPAAEPTTTPATPIQVTVADDTATSQPAASVATSVEQQIAQFQATQAPAADQPVAATPAPVAADPVQPVAAATPVPDPTPAATPTEPAAMPTARPDSTGGKKIVAPIHDINTAPVDLNALLAKEESGNPPAASTVITPTEPPTA